MAYELLVITTLLAVAIPDALVLWPGGRLYESGYKNLGSGFGLRAHTAQGWFGSVSRNPHSSSSTSLYARFNIATTPAPRTLHASSLHAPTLWHGPCRPQDLEMNPLALKALCGYSTFGLGPDLANVVATDITDLTLFFCSFRFRAYTWF